jgi:hypothetical protein
MGFLSLEAGSSVVGEYAALVSPFIPDGVLLTRQGFLLTALGGSRAFVAC